MRVELFDNLQALILGAADEPWILLVLFALCAIDGFFPPVPSESIVIALATLAAHGQGIPLWWVIPVAAVGALTGDLIAFAIGRRIPVRRLGLFSSDRGQRALDWAENQLRRRGGAFILSARYIPVGRVAVNMTAGAVGFPLRRFLAFDVLACLTWALYGVAIGTVAGQFFDDQPLLSVAAGVVGGLIIGVLLDRVLSRFGIGGAALNGDRRRPARGTSRNPVS